jgi:hypothetical protein
MIVDGEKATSLQITEFRAFSTKDLAAQATVTIASQNIVGKTLPEGTKNYKDTTQPCYIDLGAVYPISLIVMR